ncbi:hypothetical protein GEMRC1_004462 [Eukaryota sp. GEM-RC1]
MGLNHQLEMKLLLFPPDYVIVSSEVNRLIENTLFPNLKPLAIPHNRLKSFGKGESVYVIRLGRDCTLKHCVMQACESLGFKTLDKLERRNLPSFVVLVKNQSGNPGGVNPLVVKKYHDQLRFCLKHRLDVVSTDYVESCLLTGTAERRPFIVREVDLGNLVEKGFCMSQFNSSRRFIESPSALFFL